MKATGLIVEYNPMHQGHLYHIQKARELTNCDVVICVMSGNFVQRGEPAIINKFSRASIAINNGIDIVIELPFVYSVQSSDYFCKETIRILSELKVSNIIFGSESGDINLFKDIAKAIYQDEDKYNSYVKNTMDKGYRYPDACNQALSKLLNKSITTPNDILGLGYVKEVIRNNYDINIDCIKRTSDYLSNQDKDLSSAFSIRNTLLNDSSFKNKLLGDEYFNELYYLDDYFKYLNYQLNIITKEALSNIHLVDEGIENLILKNINQYDNMNDFINSLTSKRYTRTRIQRMIIHILMNNTKQDIKNALDIDYIRILKMNDIGQQYLSSIKNNIDSKLVSNFSSYQHPALDIEFKATKLLSLLSNNPTTIIKSEYQNIPVQKNA